MPPCIQISQLTKRYGRLTAVDNLNLTVEYGEVLGLLGPNGAGKSTTLYMLAGLLRPDSGRITLFGRDIRRHHIHIASRTGVLVEQPAFYDYLSVRSNLKLFSRLAQHEINLDRLLSITGLLHAGHTKAVNLSTGMRQRLGLALAMLTEPALLLLDEPTSGLDVEGTQEMLVLLRQLAEESGVTIVFSSHQMFEVEQLCDRVAIVNDGKLVACEDTEALLAYDHSRVEIVLEGAEGAAKRLIELPWVEHVEVKTGKLHVHLRDAGVHQLNSFLVTSGYQISAITPHRRTLQEYFLQVMDTQTQEVSA